MSKALDQRERDVEAARAKLAKDLQVLRAPDTLSEFTGRVKQEVMRAKDELFQSSKEKVQDAAFGFVDGLKARAAANPAAVLAIAGGVGWWLFRNPPVTTALVSAGLVSLLRTPASGTDKSDDQLWSEGATRLQEQITDAASSAREMAVSAGERALQSATDAASSLGETIRGRLDDAVDQARASAQDSAAAVKSNLSNVEHAVANSARRAGEVADDLGQGVRRAQHDLTDVARSNAPSKDSFLLAVAAVAVAGALGIASQRRL